MIVLARRQSPDWSALSATYRGGRFVDPRRYVPDHDIVGFPKNIESLIGSWNSVFNIDFFSFRAAISDISKHNCKLVEGAIVLDYRDVDSLLALGNEGFVYFHDDDDIFAPDLSSRVAMAPSDVDAIVTPLFRISRPTCTLVRKNAVSTAIIGHIENGRFRFQTNNCGLNIRLLRSEKQYYELKDHVSASHHATENNFREFVLENPISATIKTPASASMMPGTFADALSPQAAFEAFIVEQRRILSTFPTGYDWLERAVRQVVRLCEAVLNNESCEAIEDLHT